MNDKVKIKIGEEEKEIEVKKEGKVKILEIPISIDVAENSFLHIGAAKSPLSEKDAPIFKIDRIPVIPATTFKGAFRHQLELLFIEKFEEFKDMFDLDKEKIKEEIKKEILKPCLPSTKPSKAEEELINMGMYREKTKLGSKEIVGCQISVNDKSILTPKISNSDVGICPVCYFMGTTGLMGFLRFSNLYSEYNSSIIDQTSIRIDRKTGTAAHGAKVESEQVKPGTVFRGSISILISEPILEMQGIQFGDARKIGGVVIDKWLQKWKETDKNKRVRILIEEVILPAIQNIKVLGGQKSRGAGKVNVKVIL
ncbi:RAMP superfamily CRISPR-associated protein [Caloranaerobacter sp. DY30410]|uniref:RAMP superfamily CRISPR-associated protein n=1 Tax=Caloranaerobacter sp. DY30410 TaxID=3238305 RepID=UPI003D05843F